MLNRIRKARQDESGFTLIELLIVIIILGILAAIVVFAVGNTRDDAVANSCKTDYKSVELSAEAVKTKTGNDATDTTVIDPASGGLLKKLPATDNYYIGMGSGNAVKVFGVAVSSTGVKSKGAEITGGCDAL